MSVGAAVHPHDGTDYEGLLADADHRMYRDKTHRRRNRARPSDVDPANPLFPPPVPPPSREERTALH